MSYCKMRLYARLTAAVMLIAAAACSIPAALPGGSPTGQVAVKPSATPGISQTLESSATLSSVVTNSTPTSNADQPSPSNLPLTHYHLTADLDYSAHQLTVDEQIDYVNRTGQSLDEILLIVYARTLIADGFQLNGVREVDGSHEENYRWEEDHLIFSLAHPLENGQTWSVRLSYSLLLPAKAGILGRTGMQTNFGDWYPYIPPYSPEKGWLAHPPGSVGEHLLYDLADFTVSLTIRNPETGLQVAASALPQQQDNRFDYEIKAARNFSWSVSPNYERLDAEAEGVHIKAFIFPAHRDAGLAALETVRKSVLLYSQLYVPYPHDSLTLVESEFFDGMEYDGLFFLGKEYFEAYAGSPRGYLTALSAHETAHQWWYGLVGNDPALEPWLDEALCAYSELLFYEHYFPELSGWWWAFRVEPYEPEGYVDSTVYDFDAFRPYVNAIYLRGSLFLRDVRQETGDETFMSFLNGYAQSEAGKIATRQDFFSTLAHFTSADWTPLLAEYFMP